VKQFTDLNVRFSKLFDELRPRDAVHLWHVHPHVEHVDGELEQRHQVINKERSLSVPEQLMKGLLQSDSKSSASGLLSRKIFLYGSSLTWTTNPQSGFSSHRLIVATMVPVEGC
jgi:hypothetical protein